MTRSSLEVELGPWIVDEKLLNVEFSSGTSRRLSDVRRVLDGLVMRRMLDVMPVDPKNEAERKAIELVLDVVKW